MAFHFQSQQRVCTNCNFYAANPGNNWCQPCFDRQQQQQRSRLCTNCHINPPNHGYAWCNTCYNASIRSPTPTRQTMPVYAQLLGLKCEQPKSGTFCGFCGTHKQGRTRCGNCCR